MTPISFPYQGDTQRRQILHWVAAHPYAAFLDTCATSNDRYGQYDFIAAAGRPGHTLTAQSWEEMLSPRFQSAWRFGIFSYELKNQMEAHLSTRSEAAIPFPELYFFIPETLIFRLKGSPEISILSADPAAVHQALQEVSPPAPGLSDPKASDPKVFGFTGFRSNFGQADYLRTIRQLQDHILEGDCYEINLSQSFNAGIQIQSPAALWEKLIRLSPVPFAAYFRLEHTHLLCASPERFLRLHHDQLLTQPIKGTIGRSPDPDEDEALKLRLRFSEKEQAENVMIVDLSRNDLHRSCTTGSVEVERLYEVQTFPQVHHLVSTITGQKSPDTSPLQAFAHTFPPGSMTGAPKVRTCQLIDRYEPSARGIYSGSCGYFSPEGDFDLNVVIRSLVYEHTRSRISYHVGGAITADSDPEAEYRETLLKAEAIVRLFELD